MVTSAVNEKDKIAKKVNIDILYLLGPVERSRTSISVELLSQSYHEAAFVFSGLGFFEFTRGFYLAIFGCLISYSLLITNSG